MKSEDYGIVAVLLAIWALVCWGTCFDMEPSFPASILGVTAAGLTAGVARCVYQAGRRAP
jgi:hypothetical protein